MADEESHLDRETKPPQAEVAKSLHRPVERRFRLWISYELDTYALKCLPDLLDQSRREPSLAVVIPEQSLSDLRRSRLTMNCTKY
jgi:hypothetical protein